MDVVNKYKESRSRLCEHYGVHPLSKIVSTEGPVDRVHYLEIGKGEPLVLVHGGLSHSSEWINILKPLAEHYRVYAVDRPGHGLSDPINYKGVDFQKSAVDFLLSFSRALGLDQAAYAGSSMGGYFNLTYALAHPQRVKKLLLLGAPAGLNLWIPPMLRMLGVPGINRVLMNTVAKPGVSGVKMIHEKLLVIRPHQLPELYFEHCYYNQLLPAAQLAHRSLLEHVLTLSGWRKELYLTGQLSNLTMPVGFIWGDNDAFEGYESGKKKAHLVNDHKFEVVNEAGHCPWLDQPQQCVSLMVQMLKG